MLGDIQLEEENNKPVFKEKKKSSLFTNLLFYLGLSISIFGFVITILREKLPGVIIWIVGAMIMVLMIQKILIKRKESNEFNIFSVGFKIMILLASILLLYLGVYVI